MSSLPDAVGVNCTEHVCVSVYSLLRVLIVLSSEQPRISLDDKLSPEFEHEIYRKNPYLEFLANPLKTSTWRPAVGILWNPIDNHIWRSGQPFFIFLNPDSGGLTISLKC